MVPGSKGRRLPNEHLFVIGSAPWWIRCIVGIRTEWHCWLLRWHWAHRTAFRRMARAEKAQSEGGGEWGQMGS